MRLPAIMAYIAVLVAVLMLAWAYPAKAHDNWINTEHRTNAAGEWCCNAEDCKVVGFDEYLAGHRGYTLTATGEFIPHAETQPSSDQQLWICRRSDKTRRCVFAPSGGT